MRSRLTLSALALALGAALLPAGAQAAPSAGAEGIGDAYFPLDGNGGIDVISYAVDDRYRFGPGKLSGHTNLLVHATQDLSSFNLDFLLPVRSVRIDGVDVSFTKPRAHELQITPTVPLVDGQEFRVRVGYAGHPRRYRYAGERNWLSNRHEVVAMNEPHMAPWWFPANDHPQDKATMDITITAPREDQVIANGRRVSRHRHGKLATTRWSAAEPMAPYLSFFAAGKYAVQHGTSHGLPWYVAVSKSLLAYQTRTAMSLMRRTPALVNLLTKDLGAYPFTQTGGLTTGLPVNFALENQTRPTYPYVGGRTNNNTKLLVHELSHQWFGDSISVHEWKDIWLNEGFASFMELRYDERKNNRSAASWLRTAYDQTPWQSSFWTVEVADPGVPKLFANAVYYRGAMTLQALRNRVGETDFWQIIHAWIALHEGGNVSTQDFIDLAEDVSGENLQSFFQAWLYSTTRPQDIATNGLGPDSKQAASRPAAVLAPAPAHSVDR
jgi:aminopeptidase N